MAIYDGAEEESEGEQIIMDIKINVGEYVRITTKDDKAYSGLVTAICKTYVDGKIQDLYNLTSDGTVTILESQIQTAEKLILGMYLVDEIERIVKKYGFDIEESASIGKKSFALMKNWEKLNEYEKDVLTEFFIQTKSVQKILDQNARYRRFCEEAGEKLGLSGLEF